MLKYIFLMLTLCSTAYSNVFDEKYLHLLDSNEGHFLFRGNLPVKDHEFCYGVLVEAMKAELQEKNLSLKDNFKLCDISLLNMESDKDRIDKEKLFFKLHPNLGEFYLHPIHGIALNPLMVPKEFRDYLIQHHDIDGLKSLVNKMRSVFTEISLNDTVIYIHCNAGKDRTGEVSACYLMQYCGWSYKDVYELDYHIAGRYINHREITAVKWYAFYLKDVLGIASIGEIH